MGVHQEPSTPDAIASAFAQSSTTPSTGDGSSRIMEEHEAKFSSPAARTQSSRTTVSGDSESCCITIDDEAAKPTGIVNETGTASMQMQEQQEQLTPDAMASLAQYLTVQLAAPAQPSTTTTPPIPVIIIGEVGELTRNVAEAEYDPHHVCIGPYHWIKESLREDPRPRLRREEEKTDSLRAILRSAGTSIIMETAVRQLLAEVARLEKDSRSYYANSFHQMDHREFVRMLLLDGSYLLHRLCLLVVDQRNQNTGGMNSRLADLEVVRDVLYLAENQIPFFVLGKIHDQLVPSSAPAVASVAERMKQYIQRLLREHGYSVANPQVQNPSVGNLLHLLHMHFQPTRDNPPAAARGKAGEIQVCRWRRATDYYITAGVKFKRRSIRVGTQAQCVLDVKLNRGTLKVPCLRVDAETCRILRNLMALEQKNPQVKSHVTAYCIFISQLACTAADVELLSRSRVIEHTYGSHEEMAKCFADLCKGILFDIDKPEYNYLRATCQQLEACFHSRPRRWMAGLKRKYFSSPWAAMALAAASIILFCTVAQAVYAYLGYQPAHGSPNGRHQ